MVTLILPLKLFYTLRLVHQTAICTGISSENEMGSLTTAPPSLATVTMHTSMRGSTDNSIPPCQCEALVGVLGSLVGLLVVLLTIMTTSWAWTCWTMKKRVRYMCMNFCTEAAQGRKPSCNYICDGFLCEILHGSSNTIHWHSTYDNFSLFLRICESLSLEISCYILWSFHTKCDKVDIIDQVDNMKMFTLIHVHLIVCFTHTRGDCIYYMSRYQSK